MHEEEKRVTFQVGGSRPYIHEEMFPSTQIQGRAPSVYVPEHDYEVGVGVVSFEVVTQSECQ